MIDWDANCLAPIMEVFGAVVIYRPRVGTAFPISDAVFDAEYGMIEVDAQTGEQTTTRTPALGVRDVWFTSHPSRMTSSTSHRRVGSTS